MHPAILENRDDILRLARKHGAKNLRLFGSAARGDERADSDLDFLARMEEGRSLVDHVALKQDLEDLLDCEVDVVTERALHSQIREQVLQQAVSLK